MMGRSPRGRNGGAGMLVCMTWVGPYAIALRSRVRSRLSLQFDPIWYDVVGGVQGVVWRCLNVV